MKGRTAVARPDLICLSHLRWHFVFQRPQHLMTRCARRHRVFFVEEPQTCAATPYLEVVEPGPNLRVVVPHLPVDLSGDAALSAQRDLLSALLTEHAVRDYVLWYYTPLALGITRHLAPWAVVYDCMDELAAFAQAPPGLRERERELLERADLVLTGGQSLYEAKRGLHANVHAFPSSVDVPHFAAARGLAEDPGDQAAIPHPRLGYFGVIDERMDLALVDGLAAARPEWHLVLVGPVAKLDPAALPRRPNIHYLGAKRYEQLPGYLAGWDVALLPFAHNEATRFISPTKTPEYLAAGKPVVSTSIRDVVRPYGERGLAHIADDVDGWVAAVEAALVEDRAGRLRAVDDLLADVSWDRTWGRMYALLTATLAARPASARAA